MIYVACTNGVHGLSLDATNRRFSAAWTGPSDANGPPIVAGGLVWVASTGSSKLYGLDPQSGAVRVTQSTPAMKHFVTRSASDGKLSSPPATRSRRSRSRRRPRPRSSWLGA